MEPIVDKARQERAFALFLVFKVLAGLWIYQNIFNWDFINLPFAAWLLAMAVTWLAWLFQSGAIMRWAYRLEWLGLVVLWGRLLMGLLVPGQGSTKLRTAYEVDLIGQGSSSSLRYFGAIALKNLPKLGLNQKGLETRSK